MPKAPDPNITKPTPMDDGKLVNKGVKQGLEWNHDGTELRVPLMSHPFIGYRGDKRTPEEIFKVGFSAQSRLPKPMFRAGAEPTPGDAKALLATAGDMRPDDVVCISSDMKAAALFPVPKPLKVPKESTTYIYVMYVRKAWNTSHLQIERALGSWKQTKDEKMSALIGATLYGREHFCTRIEPEDVIGAIECFRRFRTGNYQDGGTFQLIKYIANSGYKGDRKKTVDEAMSGEVAHAQEQPQRSDVESAVKSEMQKNVAPRELPLLVPSMGFRAAAQPPAEAPAAGAGASAAAGVDVKKH